jgi:hypothetical protein
MNCHCGQPLHCQDPEVQRDVEKLIRAKGARVVVRAGGRAWLVDRHYIALHGIKAVELPLLGFEEVKGDRQ